MPDWPFNLAELAADSSHAMEIGKAAEHLVCAHLTLQGYRCYLSDQGLPYDIIVDLGERIVRVQVKATSFARNMNADGRNPRIGYSFYVRRRGKDGKGDRLDASHCDIVALVAMDIGVVAYIPIEHVGQTCQLLPPGAELSSTFRGGSQWGRTIAEFPFSEALENSPENFPKYDDGLTHCLHGHEFTDASSYISKSGSRICRICAAERRAIQRDQSDELAVQ